MVDPSSLKVNDPDRYLLSLFISHLGQQRAVTVFDRLNLEIGRLRDIIDTPHMGYIRLQWWKDEIGKISRAEGYTHHPLLQDLEKSLIDYPISKDDIDQLISARESDFDEYDDFDIHAYARHIHAPLLKIKARILGVKENTDSLAEGFALVGLLRSIPFYRARSQVMIPSIQPNAVEEICNKAESLLSLNTVKHPYFKAHEVLARLYLKQLKSAGYNPEKIFPLPFKELRVWFSVLISQMKYTRIQIK
ncbi:MAG: squalene/phytoene synthase family protein [Alphaproteobacteria bacterium]|nr:squalene/phytoene synthase family protein [Alphaproteobacteria bacterium]